MAGYTRVSQARVERTIDEEIILGSGRAQRRIWERADAREVISVGGDRPSDGREASHPMPGRWPMRSRPSR